MGEQCIKIDLRDIGNSNEMEYEAPFDREAFGISVAFESWVVSLGDDLNETVDVDSIKDILKVKLKLRSISLAEVRSALARVENKLIISSKSPQKGWHEDEMHILIWVVIKYSEHHSKDIDEIEDEDYVEISKMLPFKDWNNVKHKWLSMKQSNLQQIPWTKEEDELLAQIFLSFKKQDKHNKWSDISKVLESKTHVFRRGKQCRERWNNYLDPDMNRGNWSDLEDYKLLSIALELNSTQWSSIAKRLSRRTENAVKNRFKSLMKKERKERIKLGLEVKSADSLTEHIDREILTNILEKLQHKINLKSTPGSFEPNQSQQSVVANHFNNSNPATIQQQQQIYSMLLQNQLYSHPAPAFVQQNNPYANNNINSSESASPDNSPKRMLTNQILIQMKKKEEELAAQMQLNGGINPAALQQAQLSSQAINAVDLQAQLLQSQQNQALSQQFQNLNLSSMSPSNQHSILKAQLLMQQQQMQQPLLNQSSPPHSTKLQQPHEGSGSTTHITSLMQSLQTQAMQNHTALVQSPQFINQMLNNCASAAHQTQSPFLAQTSSNRSINSNFGVPSSFSEAVTIYSGGVGGTGSPVNPGQNCFANQMTAVLSSSSSPMRLPNNGMMPQPSGSTPPVGTSPYVQFQTPTGATTTTTSTAQNPLQTPNNFSPTSVVHRGIGVHHRRSSFSTGNTPSSNRNKRQEKPSQFSDYEKLQKQRCAESENGGAELQSNPITSASKFSIQAEGIKAEKQASNQSISSITHLLHNEQLLQKQKGKMAEKQRAQMKFEDALNDQHHLDQTNGFFPTNTVDSPINSQNILPLHEADSSDSSEANRVKQHLLNLQLASNSSNNFIQLKKDGFTNTLIKPQRLSQDNNNKTSVLDLEEASQSPRRFISPQQQGMFAPLGTVQSSQNNLILPGSINQLGSVNDIMPSAFSAPNLSMQQLDFLQVQQKQQQQSQWNNQLQQLYSQQNLASSSSLGAQLYNQQMNSPQNTLNLFQQKQFLLLQQQQQQQVALAMQQQQQQSLLGLSSNEGLNPQMLNLYAMANQSQQSSQKIENTSASIPQFSLQQMELLQQLQLQQQQQMQSQLQLAAQQQQQQQQFQLQQALIAAQSQTNNLNNLLNQNIQIDFQQHQQQQQHQQAVGQI